MSTRGVVRAGTVSVDATALARLLATSGLSRGTFAESGGISEGTLCRWLDGEAAFPSTIREFTKRTGIEPGVIAPALRVPCPPADPSHAGIRMIWRSTPPDADTVQGIIELIRRITALVAHPVDIAVDDAGKGSLFVDLSGPPEDIAKIVLDFDDGLLTAAGVDVVSVIRVPAGMIGRGDAASDDSRGPSPTLDSGDTSARDTLYMAASAVLARQLSGIRRIGMVMLNEDWHTRIGLLNTYTKRVGSSTEGIDRAIDDLGRECDEKIYIIRSYLSEINDQMYRIKTGPRHTDTLRQMYAAFSTSVDKLRLAPGQVDLVRAESRQALLSVRE